MADIMIRKRKRMRSKDVKTLADDLEARFEKPMISAEDVVDMAESTDFNVIFVNGDILALIYDGTVFPTVRGLLRYRPEGYFVTVDMGAVPYVTNGADIMGPGIVDADPSIREGDLVWIRDQKNLVPLAVGQSSVSGNVLREGGKGKVVKNIHNVGDKLWKAGE